MTYSETLADLFRRNRRGIKPGLEATRDLASALEVNLDALPMVLVAGTNGKGSVSSLIAHLCSNAGIRTGHYSSPHLLRFSERFRVDGQEITQEKVIELWERVRSIEPDLDHPPSFFEIATVMAHQFFQSENCDLVVFEVGLGGRLDATNAATPHLSVITNIGLDHQHILGDTLEAIAFEKAGIARRGTPCIIGPQSHPEAKAKLIREAKDHGADVETLEAPSPMAGTPDFIAANTATASAAYRTLRERILPRAELPTFTPELMSDWFWPGRFELIPGEDGPDVLVDGAHNAQALKALVRALESDQRTQNKVQAILYSCVDTRTPDELLGFLKPLGCPIYLCPSSVDRSLQLEELRQTTENFEVFNSVHEGLKLLSTRVTIDGIIVVTGSLFAVADAKACLQHLERDPPIMG